MPDGSASAHHYRPKLMTVLSEGYGLASFRKDMLAALTVAIVALPLSMAIAVASGVSPERGLYAAVIGGFLVSALGGSRYQIGGPAGAFIVLVAATVAKFGLEGLLLTVFISGFMLTLIGLLRLGSLIRYIPHAVTIGFTSGIAVTIFASQLKDLGGLNLSTAEPGQLLPKLVVLGHALPTLNPAALAVGVGSAALIFLLRRLAPNWPGMLIAVVLAAVAAWLFHLPVETIGSRFGQLPDGLPGPALAGDLVRNHSRSAAGRGRLRPARCHRIAAVGWGRGRRHDRAPPPLQPASWWRRGWPISPRPCSAASAPPARSPAPPPTCAPVLGGTGRWHAPFGVPAVLHGGPPPGSPALSRWRRWPGW